FEQHDFPRLRLHLDRRPAGAREVLNGSGRPGSNLERDRRTRGNRKPGRKQGQDACVQAARTSHLFLLSAKVHRGRLARILKDCAIRSSTARFGWKESCVAALSVWLTFC